MVKIVHNFNINSIRPFFFRPVQGDVLEIGPLDRPVIKRAKYFDVLPTEVLKEYADKVGRVPENVPEIDFYSSNSDLSIINEQFDYVVSSHVIEHQPDIIKHLRQVHDLLIPGGAYFMVVPDRRYCFDYYLCDSTPEEMKAAQGNALHTLENVIQHLTETTHNKALLHWLGFHGSKVNDKASNELTESVKSNLEKGKYMDAHAWQFTPDSFAGCMIEIEDLTDLVVERINRTLPGLQEFTAILRRPV